MSSPSMCINRTLSVRLSHINSANFSFEQMTDIHTIKKSTGRKGRKRKQ
jgi:hypothetical protein